MSLYQIPASIAKRIEQLMRNFLWSGSAESKEIRLLSWNKICTHKTKGGLRIRDLRKQNLALLGKWWWRIAYHENQLWAQVIKSKYNIPSSKWLPESNTPASGSGIWKSLGSILPSFREHIRFHARGGSRVRFWEGKILSNCKESTIEEVMTISDSRTWNPSFRRLIAFSSLTGSQSGKDSMIWTPSPSGRFSVKSFYRVIAEGNELSDISSKAWDSIAPPRAQFFLWLATLGKPLTIDNLQKRGFQIPNRCVMCLEEEENVTHLLLHCKFAFSVWSKLIQLFNLTWVIPPSIPSLLTLSFEDKWRKSGKILWKASLVATLWHLWKERNSRTFQGEKNSTHTLFHKITDSVIFWATQHKLFMGISASSFLQEWSNLLLLTHHKSDINPRWTPPLEGQIKLNFDGCSSGNPGLAGIGGVFRNFEGTILLSFSEEQKTHKQQKLWPF
ncbi:hypothetical protein AMTRI_Chr08g205860 [Amborella trichopoda]